jgi:hypothetical protein
MTLEKIFHELVLTLLEMSLALGVLVFLLSIGRDFWLTWRGDE